jgi:hypothetical protein
VGTLISTSQKLIESETPPVARRNGCAPDHIIVTGESHLRCVLFAYAAYYNQTRPHLSLQKDAPLRRAVQRVASILAIPVLAGLHHQYVRMQFSERIGVGNNRRASSPSPAQLKPGRTPERCS